MLTRQCNPNAEKVNLVPGQAQKFAAPEPPSSLLPGSIPRVTRLMALAIKFDGMLARSEVRDFADLARLGYVSRARITQIMNLLTLAPDIQEALLSLPLTTTGPDPISEHNLRPITAIPHWNRQRKMWEAMKTEHISSEYLNRVSDTAFCQLQGNGRVATGGVALTSVRASVISQTILDQNSQRGRK